MNEKNLIRSHVKLVHKVITLDVFMEGVDDFEVVVLTLFAIDILHQNNIFMIFVGRILYKVDAKEKTYVGNRVDETIIFSNGDVYMDDTKLYMKNL